MILMVIFGAGASYDSIPHLPPGAEMGAEVRPPLADDLFADRPPFAEAMKNFSACQPIIPLLRQRGSGMSVEQVLERLQAEASEYPQRLCQLAAVRFYLHHMLWECQRKWWELSGGITTYRTLLDHIERWRIRQTSGDGVLGRYESVCLVTFNYDTLLESTLQAARDVIFREVSDYIADRTYKVIKVHGSVNWARLVEPSPFIRPEEGNVWSVVEALINRVADLSITSDYRIVSEHPIGKLGTSAAFPAIAIPVETKSQFECPGYQLEALRECIPKVVKLLVIGWRGTEQHFLKFVKDAGLKPLRAMVIASDKGTASEVKLRLQPHIRAGEWNMSPTGFTGFVTGTEVHNFLRG